jgi:hypothetical protein
MAGPCSLPSLFLHHGRVADAQPQFGEPAHARRLQGPAWPPGAVPQLSIHCVVSLLAASPRRVGTRPLRCSGTEQCVVSKLPRNPAAVLARRSGQPGDPHTRVADLRRLSRGDRPPLLHTIHSTMPRYETADCAMAPRLAASRLYVLTTRSL